MKASKVLNLDPLEENKWPRKMNINIYEGDGNVTGLTRSLECIMRVTEAKRSSKEYGFVCLFTDGNGTYWFKVSRGFATALNESIASLEKLIDDTNTLNLNEAQKEQINIVYRQLNGMYE